MSSIFDNHEAEFIEAKITINTHINDAVSRNGDHEMQRAALQIARANISEAERYIKLMQVEARTHPHPTRHQMETKVKQFKDDLQGLTKDFERVSLLRQNNDYRSPGGYGNQRERMSASTQRLLSASEKIAESRRIIAETEEVGIGIMGNLDQQKQTLLASHDKVKETKSLAANARRLLTNMYRRAVANRVFLGGIIVFLIVSICLVLYYDFLRPWFTPKA